MLLWESLLESGLSLVIKDSKSGQIIGSCLNFDARSDEAAPLCACGAFSRTMKDKAPEEVVLSDDDDGKAEGRVSRKLFSHFHFQRKKVFFVSF